MKVRIFLVMVGLLAGSVLFAARPQIHVQAVVTNENGSALLHVFSKVPLLWAKVSLAGQKTWLDLRIPKSVELRDGFYRYEISVDSTLVDTSEVVVVGLRRDQILFFDRLYLLNRKSQQFVPVSEAYVGAREPVITSRKLDLNSVLYGAPDATPETLAEARAELLASTGGTIATLGTGKVMSTQGELTEHVESLFDGIVLQTPLYPERKDSTPAVAEFTAERGKQAYRVRLFGGTPSEARK